jgi:putative membrane protein
MVTSKETTMMGNGYGYGMGAGGMSGYWWFGLIVLVGVALLAVALIRGYNGGGVNGSAPTRNGDRPSELGEARQILDERYARGDLTTEEYHEHIQGLGQKI